MNINCPPMNSWHYEGEDRVIHLVLQASYA